MAPSQAEESHMKNVRSQRWSWVLLVAGAVVLFATGIVGFVNAAVINGTNFAAILNDVRQDPEVKAEVGAAIATAAIDAQPDLIAIEPAIAAAAGAVVGSPIIDGVFTKAVSSFHEALTVEGADSAVLGLADLGATVTTALEQFVPQAADVIPPDLNLTLAEIGGQEGIAAQIIPIVQVVSTLAWLLPLVALGLLVAGMWLAPRRRLALVRLGWMLVVVGGFLGLVVIGMNVAAALVDEDTLAGALAGAALVEFSQPLAVRFIATVVVGGLVVATAGALLPQIEPEHYVRRAVAVVMRRPVSTTGAILRALAIIALGTLMVLNPTLTAQVVAVVAGLAVFLYGVAELDVVAERARAADRAHREALGPEPAETAVRRPAALWLIPVGAGLVAVAVLAALILPDHLPQDDGLQTVAANSDACNGHVELCDRPFDEVVIPATHNSMSIADGTWFLAEQPKDMVESLDDGIRGLLVDTWYGQATAEGGAITSAKSTAAAEAELVATYGPTVAASVQRTIDRVRRAEPIGPEEPYFCHTVCEIGAAPMAPIMERLNAWMDAHPREVIVLFIQDTVTPGDTAAVLEAAGLASKAYVHQSGQDWPTLRQMIDAGTRLLVLMENAGGGDQYPYLHQGFELVQDTEYTFASVEDFTCTLKRGSPDSPLLSVNHWLAGFNKLVSNADLVNAYDVLRPRIDECIEVRGRIPSMIAVNWYDRGDLFRVVDELNGVDG
jgi:hypothetical protein